MMHSSISTRVSNKKIFILQLICISMLKKCEYVKCLPSIQFDISNGKFRDYVLFLGHYFYVACIISLICIQFSGRSLIFSQRENIRHGKRKR